MIIFIDDILVYSKKEGDHIGHLKVVLQVLKEDQLFSKYRKCEFLLRSMAFLGYNIYSEGVEVGPKKSRRLEICLDLCL